MHARRIIFVLLAGLLVVIIVLLFSTLWYPNEARRTAESKIHERGHEGFRDEVVSLYEKIRRSPGVPSELRSEIEARELAVTHVVEVPERDWSETVRKLNPLAVSVGDEGVYIRLQQGPVLEEGIFVAVPPLSYAPDPAANGLHRISEDIYWFEFVNG